MHIKLLKSKDSKSIAEYSGKKIRNGGAEVIHRSSPQALKLIRKYEGNPRLDARAKNLGLHFEISPGDNEQGNEERIIELATDFLKEMGLDGQPWILIRHADIKRIHYHLASTRATKEGRVIPSAWLKERTYKAAEKVIPEGGYSFKQKGAYRKMQYVDFQKERGDICMQFMSVFYTVLGLPIKSRKEFIDEMRKRHVDVMVSTKCEVPRLFFAGLSEDGKRNVSPVYNLDRNGEKLRLVDIAIVTNIKEGQSTADNFPEPEDPDLEPEEFIGSQFLFDSSFKVKDSRMLTKMIKEILKNSVSHNDFERKCNEAGILISHWEDIPSGLHIEFSGFDGRELKDFGDIRHHFTRGELDLITHDNAWGQKNQLLEQVDHKHKGRGRKK